MKRREAEQVLIAEAIKRGNISFLVAENFDPSYFENYKDIAEGLWREVERLEGYTPSRKQAETAYPDFDFTPTEEEIDITDAIKTSREAHAHDEFNRLIMTLKPKLKEPDGWINVLQELPNKLSNVANLRENSGGKDFALDSKERHDYVIERAKQRSTGNWKVNFAHPDLNDHFGGYEPGFYMYVARTGKGKTWTCLLDLWFSWMQGANVGIFSLEMDYYKVGLRLDTFESKFSNYDLNRGIIRRDQTIEDEDALAKENEDYVSYLDRIREEAEAGVRGKFKIWPMGMFKTAVTPRRIEALARDEGLDFIVIDQLELVGADSGIADERLRLNEVSREIKLMAGRMEIPILVPHQMNRETVKAKEVTDANIAGSDGPARHADFVCHLTRDDKGNIMNYNFLKGRNAPIDKTFSLKWDWNTGHYEPVDVDYVMLENLKNEDEEALDESERQEVGSW